MIFRERYSNYDLEAACEHSGVDYDSLYFSSTSTAEHPRDLLLTLGRGDLSRLDKYGYGWAQGKSKDEVLIALEDINFSTKSWWLVFFNTDLGGFPPVILIENRLCDGAHRCILAFLLGQSVSSVNFKSE